MLSAKNKKDIDVLLKLGLDINTQDYMGLTLLHKTIMTSNTKLLKELIDYVLVNPRIKNKQGLTPIFLCSKKEIFDIMLNKYGPILFTDYDNNNNNCLSNKYHCKLFI